MASINLAGKTGPEIAQMISAGELTQKQAETFVAERAVRKLNAALSKLSA